LKILINSFHIANLKKINNIFYQQIIYKDKKVAFMYNQIIKFNLYKKNFSKNILNIFYVRIQLNKIKKNFTVRINIIKT